MGLGYSAGLRGAITLAPASSRSLRSAVERPIRQAPHELVAEIMARLETTRLEERGVEIIRRIRGDDP